MKSGVCIAMGRTYESIIWLLNPTDYQQLEVAGFGTIWPPNTRDNNTAEENLLMICVRLKTNQYLSLVLMKMLLIPFSKDKCELNVPT